MQLRAAHFQTFTFLVETLGIYLFYILFLQSANTVVFAHYLRNVYKINVYLFIPST